MGSGGNNFNYFSKNKLTKLANLVQFMFMFCLENWGLGPCPLGYATVDVARGALQSDGHYKFPTKIK